MTADEWREWARRASRDLGSLLAETIGLKIPDDMLDVYRDLVTAEQTASEHDPEDS